MSGNWFVRNIRGFDRRLWLVLMLQMLIPTVWLTVRIYFVGDLPDDSGINIASQLMWIGLLYEIFQEALVVPLYFVFGSSIGKPGDISAKIRGGLVVIGLIYLVFAAVIWVFADPLVSFMGQEPSLAAATADYVRLETIASLFSMMVKLTIVAFVTMHADRILYVLLASQMILTIVLDTFMISALPFSLNVGVNGIAYSNMVVNIILLLLCLALLNRIGVDLRSPASIGHGWMKWWFRIGAYSGAESFLRNLAFMIMVVRMVNLVANQGDYWIANNFIWNWLLIPFLALGDVVKKQVSESVNNIGGKTGGYVCMTAVLLVVMYATIPIWPWFLENVMNASDVEAVFTICVWMLVPYSTFVFNTIMDSTFTGLGLTKYLLIQSICIDGAYYSFMFVLYLTGVFVPTLPGIVAMFGAGMMLDLIPASILYRKALRDNDQRILFEETVAG